MKKTLVLIISIFLIKICLVQGQGIFIYDQQATNQVEGTAPFTQDSQPVGQSFIPTLSALNFIDLKVFDSQDLNGNGSIIYVNLRSNSISGPILGTSLDLFIPSSFFDATNFFFSTSIPLVTGTQYFIQPVIQSGDNFSSFITDGSYVGGSLIYQGSSIANSDLWFREGVYSVPEPSSAILVLLGSGALLYVCRKRH